MSSGRHSVLKQPKWRTIMSLVAVITMALVTHVDAAVNATSGSASSGGAMAAVCLRAGAVTSSRCDVRNECARCARSDGCQYNLASLTCQAATPDSDPMLTVTSMRWDTLPSNITFCADSDKACATCVVSSFNPTCSGADRCTCRPKCSILREVEVTCYLQSQSTMVYSSILVIGIALPMLMMGYRYWARRHGYRDDEDIRAEIRRQLEARAQRRAMARRAPRPPSAMALQLDAWRSHRDQTKNDLDKVELATCYTLMENGGQHPPSPVDETTTTTASEPRSPRLAPVDQAPQQPEVVTPSPTQEETTTSPQSQVLPPRHDPV